MSDLPAKNPTTPSTSGPSGQAFPADQSPADPSTAGQASPAFKPPVPGNEPPALPPIPPDANPSPIPPLPLQDQVRPVWTKPDEKDNQPSASPPVAPELPAAQPDFASPSDRTAKPAWMSAPEDPVKTATATPGFQDPSPSAAPPAAVSTASLVGESAPSATTSQESVEPLPPAEKPVWLSPAAPPPEPPAPEGGPAQDAAATPLPENTDAPPAKPKSSKAKKLLPPLLFLLALGILGFLVYRFALPRLKVAQKPAELTYWGLWEPENVMQPIIADWEKEHPNIKVKYEQHSPKEYRERLQSALARGEGPDVFRFHHTWVPMLKNELDSVPASIMDAGTFERTFYPVASKSLRSGANYVGMPMEIDTLALFYNQDIFTAAGATVPKTWDELRELALQLALKDQDGKLQRGGVALGTTANIWHWSDILGLMMLQNGADLSRPTGQLAEDALAFYSLFTTTDGVWSDQMPPSIYAFATGKVAMVFGFSWDVFEVKSINPDLNFKVAPVPQLAGTDMAWASFWVEGVSKKSPDKEAAWEFVKFLTSKEVTEKLYQAESKIRLFGEPYGRVEMAGLLQADSMVAPFINQAAKAKSWYLCSRTFDNGINDRMIKYFEDAVNAVAGSSGPANALSTASQGISQVLSQYDLAVGATR